MFDIIFNNLANGILVFDNNFKILCANNSIKMLLHKNNSSLEELEEYLKTNTDFNVKNLKKRTSLYLNFVCKTIFNTTAKTINFEDKKFTMVELFKAEKENLLKKNLKEEETKRARLTSILDNLEDHVLYLDNELRYQYVNKAVAKSLGKSPEEIIGKTDLEVQPKHMAKFCYSNSLRALQEGDFFQEEFLDGKWYYTFKGRASINENEEGVFGIIKDITKLVEKEKGYKERIYRDTLTGLYNRNFYEDEGKRLYSDTLKKNKPFTLVLIDLDNLKKINDTKGHIAGDNFIKYTADIIKKHIKNNCYEIRIGGDEIALLVLGTLKEATTTATSILEEIGKITIHPDNTKTSLSIGIAQNKDSTETLNDLYLRADEALYKSKKGGKGKINIAF